MFTHISPVVVLILWLPVALLFPDVVHHTACCRPVMGVHTAAFLIGVFVWTFTEYLMHRFVFHYEPSSPEMERIFFLFHGVHHAQPQCKTRLVMPPIVSIPLALVFYGLFYLVLVAALDAGHGWRRCSPASSSATCFMT